MATAISTSGHHSLGSMSYSPDETSSIYQSNQTRTLSPTSPQFPDQTSSRLHSPTATLPEFVFPSRAQPSSAPSSFSRATSRRPVSAYELDSGLAEKTGDVEKRRSRPSALPDFSFNPSAAAVDIISAPKSPRSPTSPTSPYGAIPSRSGGHRRGTSELHGGDATSGASLLSSSPTKPAAPSSLGPSAGRKGHSHRRSAAISSHDLTFILKPNNASAWKLGGSAPTSPSDYEHTISPFPALDETIIPATEVELERQLGSSAPASPSGRTLNRNRVGFSDTIEFIPRPLSLVSSDTSSTVRGHSVSGSLSSIVSTGTSSPAPRDPRGMTSPMARPRTAGSILDSKKPEEFASPKRSISSPLVLDLPASSPTSPSTPKWAFFSRSGESSPSRSRPVSAASSEKTPPIIQANPTPPSPVQPPQETPLASIEPPNTTSRRASVSSRKSNKKQKKVKSWAGSILSRKTRPRSQKQKSLSRRSPTPPLRPYAPMYEPESTFDFNEADVTTSAEEPTTRPKTEIQTDFASWKPRQVRPQDEESMSPIIDLDAALGPFNTPSGYDAEWDASQKGSGPTKRRMHSAAGMGGFIGPGMHYHRRAESAPELVPPRFGLHRLGSSSTMADVFEEDEEDDEWEDTKNSDKGDSKCDDDEESVMGIDIKVVDAEDMHADKCMDWTLEEANSLQRGIKRKGSGLSEGERRQVSSSMKSEHSSTSLKDEPILEESPITIEENEDSLLARPVSAVQSTTSTATPPLRARQAKDLAPVDIQPGLLSPAFLTPTSPNSTSQSPFPSPRSPFSYDAQRISTAPSSITDEQGYESLLNGEPGPEYRMSVDEVPSISSSLSTMTRDSAFIHPGTNNPQFRDGQRSASLSSIAVTRKRSSMASLSRLISSSHGEKSKLSIESRPSSTIDPDKKEKEGKGKRISRMMQFWKPRDSA